MGDPIADEGNFGFGFNDIAFSDRVLRLEIMPASASNMNSGTDLGVKKFHICSLVLAAKSPFFYKLFKNGMRESQQRDDDVSLRINASEEAALMDLLNFMYGNPLGATSFSDLVDVLKVADKFEVTSCMRCCIDLLMKLPMSTEEALLCLELPSSVLVAEALQPLIDAAKTHLASYIRDFNKSQQEVAMALPLSALEVVLSSDGLQVNSEDDVLGFVLKWACVHYPILEERREVMTKHLARFLCFPYMSCGKLKQVIGCHDFDSEEVSKLVVDAFSSKVEAPYGHHLRISSTKSGFPRRIYNHRLVKVVQFQFTQPGCVVYLDIEKQECANLFPSKSLHSQEFCLDGRHFVLVAKCCHKDPSSHNFGLFVRLTKGSETCTVDLEFAVLKDASNEIQAQVINSCTLKVMEKGGWGLLCEWTDLMSDESVYFVDGILHLRAYITVGN